MITGIVVALPEEISTLTTQKIGKGCCVFIAPDILLVRSGTGPRNARTAAELALARGAARLVSWGCAAALVETLAPGDLTVVDSLISDQFERLHIQSSWLTETRNILSGLRPCTAGCLAESGTVVSSAADKKNIHSRTQATVLDMESVAIAKVARQNNIPFLAIRAIADPATMDLPESVIRSLNSDGEVVLPRLLAHLAGHPAELAGLIKLGLHFKAAQKTLKRVAQHLDPITHFSQV